MTRYERAVLVQVADALDETRAGLATRFGDTKSVVPRVSLSMAHTSIKDLLDTDKERVGK